MKPQLNASKKTIRAGSLKNLRSIYKPNWSLVSEADKPKLAANIVKPKFKTYKI